MARKEKRLILLLKKEQKDDILLVMFIVFQKGLDVPIETLFIYNKEN